MTGLWARQYGNTCYCNSVLQALYSCGPFRERVAAHRAPWLAEGEKESGDDETLLTCLRDLFNQMTFHKKRVGTIGGGRVGAASPVRSDKGVRRLSDY